MPLGRVLYESGDTMRRVCCPTGCVVSLLCVLENGSSAEISVVGNEGTGGSASLDGFPSEVSASMAQFRGLWASARVNGSAP